MPKNIFAEKKANYVEFKQGYPEFKTGSQFFEYGNAPEQRGLGGGGGIPKTGLLQWLFKDNQPAFSGNEVIDYSGNDNNGLLVKSNCLQPVTDITITLSTPRIGATVTELNTSTTELTGVAINGSGHIAITQASLVNSKIWQLKLSTGEELVFSIGAFNKVYSVSSTANTGTLSGVVTTNWEWATQDEYHYNVKNGCNGWTNIAGSLIPINNFNISTEFNCTLEFDVYLTSSGIILNGFNGSPYIWIAGTYLRFSLLTPAPINYDFSNLGTEDITWLNTHRRVKFVVDKTIGSYGAITCTVSNVDGSSSVSQTLNFADATIRGGQFYYVGTSSLPYAPATGSRLSNLTYTALDVVVKDIIDYNIFYPKKIGQNVDVLGNTCLTPTTFLAETKIKLNPNAVQDLTDAGYSDTFERAYNSTNPFLGKEFSAGHKNYLIYSVEKEYKDIIKLHDLLTLDHCYITQYFAATQYCVGNANRSYTFIMTGASYNVLQFVPLQYTRITFKNTATLTGYQAANTTKALILNNSTLHISGINCRFDNLGATAQNMRYVIHSDTSTAGALIQIFTDVKATHLGNLEAVAYYNALDGTGAAVHADTAAYGAGHGSGGSIYTHKNCEYIGHNYAGFFLHSRATAAQPNFAVLKNVKVSRTYGTLTDELRLSNFNNGSDRIDFENVELTNATNITFSGTHEDHYTIVDKKINGYVLLK